ncbi:mismatch repair ATPase [Martiniozyma asiatica (nom. inval.)]|nr:mismatch repair ATPase [Martiniozyma asiatica]
MSSPATRKMKQASLMNFFKKGPTTSSPFPSSSPMASKSMDSMTPIHSSPLKHKTPIKTETKSDDLKPGSLVKSKIAELKEKRKKKKSQEKSTPDNTIIENSLETPSSLAKNKNEKEDISDSDLDANTAIEKVPSSPVAVDASRKRRVNYSEVSDDNEEEDDDEPIVKPKRRKFGWDDVDDDDFKMGSDSDDDDRDVEESKISIKDELSELNDNTVVDELNDKEDSIDLKDLGVEKKKSTAKKSMKDLLGGRPISSPKSKKPFSGAISPQKKFNKENEERYQWLIKIRDADGRFENDPDYDPRTLYIPDSAWAKFTAFEKQYWGVKGKMWDTVVFFKKGKFYELYEKDADIAHNKFDLKLAGTGRANMRLAGIPEMSFEYWTKRFIDEGYKVAKVDQKETALGKEIKAKQGLKSAKEAKVIERELSYILTCGTLTDEHLLRDEMSKFCLAIKELVNNDESRTIGVCFVDVSTGKLYIIQFNDDNECTKLETLLSQIQPMEILSEKNGLSPVAMRIVRFNSAPNAAMNFLKPETEFWVSETAFDEVTKGGYYGDVSEMPQILKSYYEQDKTIGFSAFGALLWYLKSLKLDKNVISMKVAEEYDPFSPNLLNTTMRLDGTTLQNLEIFANTFDKSDRGTLFKILNKGLTSFGKRMFKNWVLHPLLNKNEIDSRLDSVESILNDSDIRNILETYLSKLADVERMLARIHSGNLRPKDFVKVITSFQNIRLLLGKLKEIGVDNLKGMLSSIVKNFPISELESLLDQWEDAFDKELAQNENIIVPNPGIEPEYDESNELMKNLESKLDEFIKNYRKEFGCKDIIYKDSGKELYLIEVPSKFTSKIPISWIQKASTAKVKRYWSPEVKDVVKQYMEAKELHSMLCGELQQKIYAKFDAHYVQCQTIIKSVAKIDCLLSLSRASESLGFPLCRPNIIEKDYASVEFKQLRHPCFIPGSGISSTQDYIPNDVSLGVDNKNNIGLLTGANAAGKSTLLRMTCVAVIMAQIGCFIPAESAQITPVDSIMTRLGANDNIMQGKSTFYVELLETKRMLDTATPRSLVVLDELGRGGSSSDGFAIAESTLHHFATHIQSIGFFATHYANLGDSFNNHPKVIPLRMAILVDNNSKKITFLYKLEEGKSNGSFGLHVARMCGIPERVISQAEVEAKELEHTAKLSKSRDNLENIIPIGLQSDLSWLIQNKEIGKTVAGSYNETVRKEALSSIFKLIEGI